LVKGNTEKKIKCNANLVSARLEVMPSWEGAGSLAPLDEES